MSFKVIHNISSKNFIFYVNHSCCSNKVTSFKRTWYYSGIANRTNNAYYNFTTK